MSDILSYEQVLLEFQQAVEHSIGDALRIPARDHNPYNCAKQVWESNYKNVLHESVLDEYKDRETLNTGEYTPIQQRH